MIIKQIDRFVIIVIITGLLLLSYFSITISFNFRLEVDDGISSQNFNIFIFVLLSLLLFDLFHKTNRVNLILWLLFGWLIIGYFITIPIGYYNIISAFYITFWLFCFSFGERLSKTNDVFFRFFINRINLILILPLSLFCIVTFFSTDLINNQKSTDAFLFITVYLPFVLMMEEKKTLKIILFSLIITIAFISMKRSLIIGVVVCSLIYILLTNHNKMFSKWYFWVFLLSIIVLSRYLYDIVSETLFYRFVQLEEDGGTGRDIIYKKVLDSFQESDFYNIILGHGYLSVKLIVGKLAHNDLIQLLYDYGLIGASLYLLFIFSLIKLAVRGYRKRKKNKTLYAAFISTLVFYIILSSMNCFIYSSMLISPLMLALGLQSGLLKE